MQDRPDVEENARAEPASVSEDLDRALAACRGVGGDEAVVERRSLMVAGGQTILVQRDP
jgi:hypothetical protein